MRGVYPQNDGSALVRGSVPVAALNRAMAWDLPEELAATVAGLLIHEAAAIPARGQMFAFYDLRFEVLRKNRNRITILRVTPQHAPGAPQPRPAASRPPRPTRRAVEELRIAA